jgi:dihydrolipoamide dehydrogenase
MRISVLGAGPGGYVAAIKAAQLGASVTVIAASEVGGTCLHWGCIPTKALIASAEALNKARNINNFGIDLNGSVTPNLQKIVERKNRVVNIQVKGIRGLFKSWDIKILDGRGTIVSPKKIKVALRSGKTEEVETDKIIIATGSRPAPISIFPFDGERILSSDDAIKLSSIPTSLLIVGAGVIGCEFAFIYKEFGADVTMVEMMPMAVSTEDEEISAILEKELKKKKIKLLTGVKVENIDIREGSVLATLSGGKTVEAEKVLVSIGRSMNSNDIGLENVGVKIGKRGEIIVNNKMETNIEGVYAVGDVTGGIMLAHVASKEGMVAAENAVGGNTVMSHDVVPAAIFTSPEIASVGLREKQALEKGYKVKVGRFQYRTLGKAHAIGEITGLIKIIADEENDIILGTHIIGSHASDLVHEAALAVEKKLSARDIAHTIHAHPTLAEGIMEAAEDVHGSAIHSPKT